LKVTPGELDMSMDNVTPTSPRRRRPGKSFYTGIIVAAVLLVVVFFGRQYVTAAVSNVQFLTIQEVGQATALEGLLIKEEKITRSPVNGKLHLVAQDGRRVGVGAKVVEIIVAGQDSIAEKVDIFTTSAGIFCNHIDGLENILLSDNIDVLDLQDLEKINGKQVCEGERAEKGQPIFKIIDNLSPIYFYGEFPKTAFDSVEKEWLHATWENQPLLIMPVELAEKGDSWVGYFQVSGYPEKIVHQRKARLSVTSKLLRGFLVPKNAVVNRGEEPGIYLVVKNKAQWTPVKIEGELAGKVAVSGQGIVENNRYVSNPILAKEGWPVE